METHWRKRRSWLLHWLLQHGHQDASADSRYSGRSPSAHTHGYCGADYYANANAHDYSDADCYAHAYTHAYPDAPTGQWQDCLRLKPRRQL